MSAMSKLGDYGAGGAAGGSNIPISVPPGTSSVTFVGDQVSHITDAHSERLKLRRDGCSWRLLGERNEL